MGDSSESLSKPEAEQLAELEAEFQSELERNAMAVRLLQQKAEEAKNAKLRVDQSQKRMETMQEKYTHMHKKVESTRQTLHEAEDRIVRQDKIRETCKDLQERARNYEEKMRQRQESNAMFTAEIGDFDFPIPLIDYDDDDEKIDGACAAAFASLPSANNEKSDTVSTDHVTTITTAQQQQQQLQQPQQVEDQEVPNIDLNDSVQRLEAKCAGVREELGRMALSETYMRTKQAQLKAKKKEMLAQQAMIRAELKEKEAADMRQKVANMMKMLADRKMKLKVTENVIDKKDAVVDGVNKILERKERRAHYTQKQLAEQIAFGKKGAAKK